MNNIAVMLKNKALLSVSRIIAQGPETDLVLLEVNSSAIIKPLKIAENMPDAGEHIFVIGAPCGYSHTLTDCLLSAVNRGENSGYISFITVKEHKIQQRQKIGKTFALLKPIKSTLPSAFGVHFWFEIISYCIQHYHYQQ